MRGALAALLLTVAALQAQSSAVQTQRGMKVAEGLEVTVWAAEPLVVNPTHIDIDERGRIWYLEAVNYRRRLRNLPDFRKEGDRIVILEDTTGDGRADKRTVFDQNPDLRSAAWHRSARQQGDRFPIAGPDPLHKGRERPHR